ncbi:MAG: hypothetical protein M0R40_00635 [Firmicutes bacterium]|nr:hypothetical protein [Bacillota bacterium]
MGNENKQETIPGIETFDDARQASEADFNTPEQEVEGTPAVEETAVEGAEGNVTEEAVKAAEAATEVATEKDEQLQQVMQEIEALKAENQNLQELARRMSDEKKEEIIEAVMPTLDVSSLTFDDEDTIKSKQEEYARQMAEFVKDDVMKDLQPFVEQAKAGAYEKEKTEVISSLAQVPELQGIQEMLPQLDRIIANNKALSSPDLPTDEKYIMAYAIAKGVSNIKEGNKEPTAEELMELYEKNKDFQDLIEKKRVEQVQGGQQVPPFSASSGAVNAALNIKEKPKTWDDASERTRNMFTPKK